ncbi:5'-nucleotidase, partial [Cladorrhinum sp. PSN259]
MIILSSKVFAPRQNSTAGDVTALLQKLPIDIVCCVMDSTPGSNAHDLSPYSNPLNATHVNLVDAGLWETEAAIPGGSERVFEIREHGKYKIGFFGMVGIDWSAQKAPNEVLSAEYKKKLIHEAQMTARMLRKEYGCNFVIAVTNMRLHEDMLVSDATIKGDSRIDLIFGGSDGEVVQRSFGQRNTNPAVHITTGKENGAIITGGWVETLNPSGLRIIKSGTEWESLSVAEVCVREGRWNTRRNRPNRPKMEPLKITQLNRVERHPYFSTIPPAKDILLMVDTINGPTLQNLTTRPLFVSQQKLNGQELKTRHAETNLGNFIADSISAFFDADITLYPSNSIRCDRILGAGSNNTNNNQTTQITITGYDVIDCVPFQNNLVLRLVQGKDLLAALENSLSDRHSDGRFLQVSGLKLEASWQRNQGRRLISANWTLDLLDDDDGIFNLSNHTGGGGVHEEPIRPDQNYVVAMTEWLANGWGGYNMLSPSKPLPPPQSSKNAASPITDTDLILSTFAGWSSADERWFWSDQGEDDIKWYFYDRNLTPREYALRNVRHRMVRYLNTENALPGVNPVVDGRIRFVKEQKKLKGDEEKAVEGED